MSKLVSAKYGFLAEQMEPHREIVKSPVNCMSIRRGRTLPEGSRENGWGVRTTVRAALCGTVTVAGMFLGPLAIAQVRQFDVPSEDAGRSIPELARQAGIQVVAPGEQLHGVITPEIKGTFDVIAALNLMLKGTGLVVSRSSDGIVTISPPEPKGYEEREGMLKEQKTAVSVLALLVSGALYGGPANAQAEAQLETVVVTGQRASIESAIQFKAKATEIVDSVSAEDVGKLPDNSVTEVLQRIAGVNITRIAVGTNSESYVGEGTGLQIRGLDSVVSQLNGRDTFSSSNGRNLAWEDVPPELMQGVDVYKSLSASLPEGGFGGIINLRTRQPFDFDGFTATATLSGNYADYSSEGHLGGVGMISDRWNTKIGEIGVLLNVAYSDLATKADGVQVTPYLPIVVASGWDTSLGLPWSSSYGLSNDNGGSATPIPCGDPATSPTTITSARCQEVYAPQSIGYTEREDRRIRTGLYASAQWRPNETLEFYLTGFRSRYHNNTLQHTVVNRTTGYVTLMPTSNNTFDANGNLLTSDSGLTVYNYENQYAAGVFGLNSGWAYQNAPYNFESGLTHQVNQTADFSAGGEWNPNDRLSVKFAVQHIESMAQQQDHNAVLYTYISPYGVTLSPYGDAEAPVLAFPAVDMTQKSRYGWQNTQDHLVSNGGQENALYADGSYVLSDTGFFRVLKFGVKVTDRTEHDWETNYNYRALTPSYGTGYVQGTVGSGGFVPTYGSDGRALQCFAPTTTCQALSVFQTGSAKYASSVDPSFVTLVDTGDWFQGKGGLPARIWFPSVTMLNSDFTALHDYNNPNSLAAPGDVGTAVAFDPHDYGAFHERVYSGYLQANFAWDKWRPISGNFGVRVVHYKDTSTGYMKAPYYTSPIYLTPPSANYVDCTAGGANFITNHCIASTGYVPDSIGFQAEPDYGYNSGGHSETFALPSLNVQMIPAPDTLPGLKLRLAASQGVSQPSFSQMSAKGSFNGAYVGNYQGYFSGSSGNPNLKPMKAEQVDASIEYYFETGGLVHFSSFYKQIHNYIATGPVDVTKTIQTYAAGGSAYTGNSMGCYTPAQMASTTTPLTPGDPTHLCPQTVDVSMVMPQNQKKAALVRGFEVGLQKYADFLPDPYSGFGVDVNYTYISSSQPGALAYDMKGRLITGLPALGLSKNTINAALLYDKKPLSIKIAYNWRDEFLVTTGAYQTTGSYNYILNLPSGSGSMPQGTLGNHGVVHYSLPVYQYPTGQLDASVTVDLTDSIQWSIQASNLTKEIARLFMGDGPQRVNRSWYTADTRYTSQLRVKF
jgi:iron complex outermembrane recepter protein